MSGRDSIDSLMPKGDTGASPGIFALAAQTQQPCLALVFGELIALVDGGRCPLVTFSNQLSAAGVRARSLVDLEGHHIGRNVALAFEGGDLTRPIVIGLLQESVGWPVADPGGHVEVATDGNRLIVTAQRELILQCGKASITLSSDGRIEIRGEYIITQAIGCNRIRGGSVELN